MKNIGALSLLVASTWLSGCSSSLYRGLPVNEAAYAIIPPIDKAVAPTQYLIAPGDTAVPGKPETWSGELSVDGESPALSLVFWLEPRVPVQLDDVVLDPI